MKTCALLLLLLLGTASLWTQGLYEYPTPREGADSTIAWKRGYLEGYTQSPSVRQGDSVYFKVSTLASWDPEKERITPVSCAMKIYRVTRRTRTLNPDSTWLDQLVVPERIFTATFYPQHDKDGLEVYPDETKRHPYDYRRGCNWPNADSLSTAGWPNGVYYAKLYLPGYESGEVGYIPFVVRPLNPGSTSTILCVLSWNTYQAYNYWGGGSLYWWGGTYDSPDSGGGKPLIRVVSFHRPFVQFVNPTGYPWTTQMGQIDHRERAFMAWGIEHGYPIEYCIDADINGPDGAELLGHYRSVVVPGHSEYWTQNMRSRIEFDFKSSAGNLAFMAANICYWKVLYQPVPGSGSPDSMWCDKYLNAAWWRNQVDALGPMHEARFIGAEYMGNNDTAQDKSNKVVDSTHWIYRGTGLSNSQQFGFGSSTGEFNASFDALVSGESDMRKPSWSPPGTQVLASVFVRPLIPPATDSGDVHYGEDSIYQLYSHMTYYEDQSTNSRVFAAGGFGWSTSLFGSDSVQIDTMHRNILDHFSGKKYVGNVYTDELHALKWTSKIELDGNVDVLGGKYLKITADTVTVDNEVTFAALGTIEISSGAVTITGKNFEWGTLVVRDGGTLKVKAGATLTLVAPLHFVVSTGGSVVLENGATLIIKTSSSFGGNISLTVPLGATLKIEPAAELFFGSGSGIVAYGNLQVNGNSSVRIRLTSLSPDVSWNGILVSGSGANGSQISYAIIDKVASSGGAAVNIVGAIGTTVEWCDLSNNGNMATTGIYLQSAGTPTVRHNTIVSNGGYGVIFSSTDGTFYGNTLRANASGGVYCEKASPTFGTTGFNARRGNNRIIGGTTGISANIKSSPVVGIYPDTWNGYNSIDSTSSARVTAVDESQVLAEGNWWGSSQPDSSWFQGELEGSIRWDYYLTSDPFDGRLSPASGAGDSLGPILTAIRQRVSGEYTKAKETLKSLILAAPTSNAATEAITQLVFVYRESHDAEILLILQSLLQSARKGDTEVMLALATVYGERGDVTSAVSLLNDMAIKQATSLTAKTALVDLFYLYLTTPGYESKSQQVMNKLQTDYPNDSAVRRAAWISYLQSKSVSRPRLKLGRK